MIGEKLIKPIGVLGHDRRCQTKFYTACLRAGTRWSSTVFAHELSQRAASFEPENGLYSFALIMPIGPDARCSTIGARRVEKA
jgi:hypothetical protein